ncbi:insulin gene enhancer protein isl-1-like [Sinocyclocheilus anshuiensis]|uniref:insulin gene enhancer protein isl-1-like n=1 Tax=Sinocyclocheilus anshuiensis TaxID=1608454 RepID=UPI0007B7CA5C|nr:PREDICTED: insulin gene enhancer protein isl-1-like [Sinocyclocheilus anshuiensis]
MCVLKGSKLVSCCVGCGQQILDRFILRVFPDLEWHAQCLKCAECQQYLDESCTCFIRDGKTFCKDHHRRLWTSKCAKCHKAFISKEYVMQTRVNIYHVQCFHCEGCNRQLLPGDEYVLRDGQLLCTDHHELFNKFMGTSDNQQKETVDPSEGIKSSPSWSSMPRRSERSTRVRTVLSESQLHMLQTCYSANPRPDALMKEQLVEMTGLSPRVIRVWFQNKRCKDKKRGLMMRSTQQQLEGCLVSEEPLLLDSPERQDSDVLINPPWKLLTDFILQKDAEHRSYQQLLSFSKEGSCSAGSEVVSISAQLADTPSSQTASPADMIST